MKNANTLGRKRNLRCAPTPRTPPHRTRSRSRTPGAGFDRWTACHIGESGERRDFTDVTAPPGPGMRNRKFGANCSLLDRSHADHFRMTRDRSSDMEGQVGQATVFDLGGKSRALLPSHGLRSDRVTATDGRQGGVPSCSDRGGGRAPNPPAVGRSVCNGAAGPALGLQ